MADEDTTGPALYERGIGWLETAQEYWAGAGDERGETMATSAAQIAAACFAGAQAAAFGSLAASETEDDALAKAWRAAIGDSGLPDHPALAETSSRE